MHRDCRYLTVPLLLTALVAAPTPARAQAGRGGISAGRPTLTAPPAGGRLPRLLGTAPGGRFHFRSAFPGATSCVAFVFDDGFCVRGHLSNQPFFSGEPFIFGAPSFSAQPFALQSSFRARFFRQQLFPFWGFFGGIDALVAGDEPLLAEQAAAPQPHPRGSKLIVVGGPRGDDVVEVRQMGGGTLQLTRPGNEAGIQQVTLFLADSLRHTLDEHTVRSAPYTATFDTPSSATAFVGTTVTYANGTVTSTFVPYVGR